MCVCVFFSSVTRRSAGLPIVVQTVLQAEKRCKSVSFAMYKRIKEENTKNSRVSSCFQIGRNDLGEIFSVT